jgi:hypothetical protein
MAGVRCLCLLLLVCGDTKAKKLSSDTGLPDHEHHLVQCCGNIISTQFDEERSLLVSVPEEFDEQYKTTNSIATSRSYCKVTDFLFASIHSYHNYPLLVTGRAQNDTFKNILPSEKATDFVIILGKGDEDTVFSVFKSELERLSHLPIWNPRGRFIVMSLSRKIPPANYVPEEHKLISRILGELWENDVVNSIVLVHNMDADTLRTTVDIHTWFPFTENHCRGPADRTVILDQCVVNSECQFVKNAKLFPDKMQNFHGCVLRASTYPHEPFIISKNKKYKNVTPYSEGLEISVLQKIASHLNFTVEYLPEPESNNHKILSLHDEVSKKQSDVGFAAAPHSSHGIDKRDYTIGYVRETVKWFGPIPKPVPHWKGFVIHFTPLMWLLVLVVYLIASIIFWSLANIHRSVNEHVSYKNPVLCFLQTFSVVLGEAVFVRPQTWFLRSFFVVWVYYCLLINTAYQSSLISVLTRPRFEPPVDTVEKLLHSQMPYGYITLVKHWYDESEDAASKTILANGIECPSLDHCLKRIISTQDFAVCGGGLHILYLSYRKRYSYSRGPKFIPFKDEVVSYLASMFFRTGSPHLESFNRIIYRLVESGMVQKLWEDIKLEHIAKKEKDVYEYGDEGGPDTVVLTVDHLHGAFILLLLGLACGLIVFLRELLCFRFGKCKFLPPLNTSVREFKSRSYVKYKHHVIHKTLLRHVKKRNLIGQVKKITLK